MAVESRCSMLRACSASNACSVRDEPSSKRVGVVGLCRMPAKATAGVADVGKIISIPRSVALYGTRCWRAGLGMHHADLGENEQQ